MLRLPPISTLKYTIFPNPTPFLSYPRLGAAVGQLPGERGKDEEGQDENSARQRVEPGFGFGVLVDGEGDEDHHRHLIEIIVEGVEELGREQGQEPALLQKREGTGHAKPTLVIRTRDRRRPFGQFGWRPAGLSARAHGVKAHFGTVALRGRESGTMLSLPNLLTLSRILAEIGRANV